MNRKLLFLLVFVTVYLTSCANYGKIQTRKCESAIGTAGFNDRNINGEVAGNAEKREGIVNRVYKVISGESSSRPEVELDGVCDSVVLSNGDKYSLKILETDRKKVLYSKCESPDKGTYIIRKENIKEIKYSDGWVDHFNNTYTPEEKSSKRKKKNQEDLSHLNSLERNSTSLNAYESNLAEQYAWLAIVSFFLIYTSPLIFIFCPLAFKFGNRVTKRGEVEKGSKELKQARFGKAIGLAFYIGWSLAIVGLLVLLIMGGF